MNFTALAIYSRSPAAFRAVKSLGILQLPCDKTVQKFMHRHNTSCGINEQSLLLNAERYDRYKSEREKEGLPMPLSKGVLIWDEVKVWGHPNLGQCKLFICMLHAGSI